MEDLSAAAAEGGDDDDMGETHTRTKKEKKFHYYGFSLMSVFPLSVSVLRNPMPP